jgi:thioredoxin-related protein
LIPLLRGLLLTLWLMGPGVSATEREVPVGFDDFPLPQPLEHPDWFKRSFLDLGEDLAEARSSGKQGLIVYFGQKRCAYCRMLLEKNWRMSDVVRYTRRHFDVVPISIWGLEEVTDLQGNRLSERDFAVRENANFTPSLIFYDSAGNQALMLRGYYPPYQFRAALEYVADGHYQREGFAAYLERGDATLTFEPGDLNEADFFQPPPFNLDRSRLHSQRPLAVFFEQGDCHACDVLHTQPLHDHRILQGFQSLDSVQLDIRSDQPVITPDGQRTSARQWARSLGLFYTPSILFFDEAGLEILRVDSVAHFFRLNSVLNYVISHAFVNEPNFMRWRLQQEAQSPVGGYQPGNP